MIIYKFFLKAKIKPVVRLANIIIDRDQINLTKRKKKKRKNSTINITLYLRTNLHRNHLRVE